MIKTKRYLKINDQSLRILYNAKSFKICIIEDTKEEEKEQYSGKYLKK